MSATRVVCRAKSESGFSLPELMISLAIVAILFGAVTTALVQMSNAQRTIWNRTEMHSGVRGATEVLQQEVGQAGRVVLPGTASMVVGTAIGTQSTSISSTNGMFVGEQVVVDTGDNQETVSLTAVSAGFFTAAFTNAHAAGVPVMVFGGFSSGVVPPSMANGSTATVLKIYGDINGDGNMVYVEYTCDTAAKNLYRNSMAWNAATKPAVTGDQVLLSNIVANPGGTACFTYQTQTVSGTTYVTNVAITLTVQTQQVDPITKQFQLETKALLNVSPRNVFNVWELASIGLTNRVQPMPPTILNLLH
jgi:prepilin-type N-terminal cleavage/methylation domain-containing protein